MYRKAQELPRPTGGFYGAAVRDPANAKIHENTTARELIADSMANGSTIGSPATANRWNGHGLSGRVLRKERPDTKIILSEPSIAQLLGSGVVPRARPRQLSLEQPLSLHARTRSKAGPLTSFRMFCRESVDKHYFDETDPDRRPPTRSHGSRRLASEEGIFTGISGGASLRRHFRSPERATEGSVICCMLPDTGERYLSTPAVRGPSRLT